MVAGMATITYTGTLTVLRCWCGITLAVPQDLRDHQLRHHHDGTSEVGIYCPLGHQFIPSGEPQYKRLERRLANKDEDLRAERASHATTKGQLTATKGQLTKTRKRAANGVCPCCQRSFVNVARHVRTKHPEALA